MPQVESLAGQGTTPATPEAPAQPNYQEQLDQISLALQLPSQLVSLSKDAKGLTTLNEQQLASLLTQISDEKTRLGALFTNLPYSMGDEALDTRRDELEAKVPQLGTQLSILERKIKVQLDTKQKEASAGQAALTHKYYDILASYGLSDDSQRTEWENNNPILAQMAKRQAQLELEVAQLRAQLTAQTPTTRVDIVSAPPAQAAATPARETSSPTAAVPTTPHSDTVPNTTGVPESAAAQETPQIPKKNIGQKIAQLVGGIRKGVTQRVEEWLNTDPAQKPASASTPEPVQGIEERELNRLQELLGYNISSEAVAALAGLRFPVRRLSSFIELKRRSLTPRPTLSSADQVIYQNLTSESRSLIEAIDTTNNTDLQPFWASFAAKIDQIKGNPGLKDEVLKVLRAT